MVETAQCWAQIIFKNGYNSIIPQPRTWRAVSDMRSFILDLWLYCAFTCTPASLSVFQSQSDWVAHMRYQVDEVRPSKVKETDPIYSLICWGIKLHDGALLQFHNYQHMFLISSYSEALLAQVLPHFLPAFFNKRVWETYFQYTVYHCIIITWNQLLLVLFLCK